MTLNRHADELEQLLHAQEPVERAELAAFLSHVQESLPETPPADVAERHLAAITTAAAEAAHSVPAAASTPANNPWRTRVRRLAGLTAVKVAIGATAAAAATGTGLAATGNLPDPVQQVVADVADRIGIDIPAPAATSPDRLPDEAPITVPPRGVPAEEEPEVQGVRPTPSPARPDGGAPPTEVPGKGEPPTDPSGRADDRGTSGRDDVAPATRQPEGDDPVAEPEEDAEAPAAVTGNDRRPTREAVPALPALPEVPGMPERANR